MPSKPKTGTSSFIQPLSTSSENGVNELSDNSNSKMHASTISQQLTVPRPKPNLNDMLKNTSKFSPSLSVHTLNSSSLKPKESTVVRNGDRTPISSTVKPLALLRSPVINRTGKNKANNTNETSDISAESSHNEHSIGAPGSSTLKDEDKKPNKPLFKQQATVRLGNGTKTPHQIDLKSPSTLPSGMGVNSSESNLIKASNKVNFKTMSASNPQVNSFSLNKNIASQQFSSQEEDKIIENGIKALQNRLQVPLEISAVAKSSAGCQHRLCKEKVKTQQAKTRGNIDNRGKAKRFACSYASSETRVNSGGDENSNPAGLDFFAEFSRSDPLFSCPEFTYNFPGLQVWILLSLLY